MEAKCYLIVGRTGAGKTTYARNLSSQRSALHFSLDEWMKTLFWMDAPPDSPMHWAMERVHRVEAMMEVLTEKELRIGHSVILDLGFANQKQRNRWFTWLSSIEADFEVVYLNVPKEIRWARIQARHLSPEDISAPMDQKTFELMDQFYDELSEAEIKKAKIIN
jgi:predicted kinase